MKWFNNLRVAIKVFLGSLTFLLLMSIIAWVGITSLRSSSSGFESFYNNQLMPMRYINKAAQYTLQIRSTMMLELQAAQAGNWAEAAKVRETTVKLNGLYVEQMNKYKAANLSPEERKLVAQWEEVVKVPRDARLKMFKSLDERDVAAAEKNLEEWVTTYKPLQEKTDEMVEYIAKYADEIKDAQMKSARNAIFLSIIVFVIAILVSIVTTIIIARSISGPVAKGLAFAKRLAEGDFTDRIALDQKDELGELSRALNTAADDLERLVSEITVGAQNLTQAVDEIASGNQNLSQRTSEQASSLEEIASTIEEATAAIRQNADNADQANRLSIETTRLAEEGNTVVTEAVYSINEISKSSKKIEEIISVINEITFQTNLLALNAAVEAARAGEQGRGFAVVAGEVRNLAQRSANAAKEIGTLIKESVNTIGIGTEKANRSGEALKEIVNSMKNVARLVSEIAAASQEQKQGIDQINVAVTEMDTMTQQNAALVEETASASEEMAGQARELHGMMERFKVKDVTRTGVFEARHKEVHLRAAEMKKAIGPEPQQKRKEIGGMPVIERRKPDQEKKVAAGDDIKHLMKEEGFEEF